jgi:hypothetical protein
VPSPSCRFEHPHFTRPSGVNLVTQLGMEVRSTDPTSTTLCRERVVGIEAWVSLVSRLVPPDLLNHPAGPVWVAEGTERVVVAALRIRPRNLKSVLEVEQFADRHPSFNEGGAGALDVGDHEMQSLYGARRLRIPHERD